MKATVYIDGNRIGECEIITGNYLIIASEEPLVIKRVCRAEMTMENILGGIKGNTIEFLGREGLSLTDYEFLILNAELQGFSIDSETEYKMFGS